MNILPKKRWHVRTRENIARVRKDEAEAAEEERKRQQKIELAEKEARTALLKEKARAQYGYIAPKKEEPRDNLNPDGHVNLFYELEQNNDVNNKKNAEHEREAKEERDREEMKIGYLTYLGQDTNELNKTVSWYNRLPIQRQKDVKEEVGLKEKSREDPLAIIKKHFNSESMPNESASTSDRVIANSEVCVALERKIPNIKKKKDRKKDMKKKKKIKRKHKDKKMKRKKHRSSISDDEKVPVKPKVDIIKLREERLKREQIERHKSAALLAKLRGETEDIQKPPELPQADFKQKYHSQFNPHIARQNFME